MRKRNSSVALMASAIDAAKDVALHDLTPKQKSALTVVGIDPGQSTGVAVYLAGKLVSLQTLAPDQLEAWLEQNRPGVVFFEDSRKTSKTFTAGKVRSVAAALKIARNVGEIDRLCKDIEAMCQRLGIECYGVAPESKASSTGKGAKVNAVHFAQITGWPSRSSQHTRDAAMVAWPYRNKASKA